MTIEEIIEKGMNGGYVPEGGIQKEWNPQTEEVDKCADVNIYEAVLDPNFWKSVGKVEGWDKYVCSQCGKNLQEKGCTSTGKHLYTTSPLKYHMHAMIDHIIKGGTIEGYIESL